MPCNIIAQSILGRFFLFCCSVGVCSPIFRNNSIPIYMAICLMCRNALSLGLCPISAAMGQSKVYCIVQSEIALLFPHLGIVIVVEGKIWFVVIVPAYATGLFRAVGKGNVSPVFAVVSPVLLHLIIGKPCRPLAVLLRRTHCCKEK